MNTTEALLIYKEEIDNRNFFDWMKTQASFIDPLHKYKGTVRLSEDIFEYEGTDHQGGKHHLLVFSPRQLKGVHYGFDTSYRAIEDRGLGMTFQPLRLEVENGNKTFIFYLIFNFNRFMRTSTNKEWFEKLNQWRKVSI